MDRLDPVGNHCHKLTQGLKVSFWGSVREKFSVNNKMNDVRNICWASFMPAVTSFYQVHAQNADTHISPVVTGGFGGLSAPNKAPSPPNWNMKQYKLVEFFSNFNVKPPCTNLKPPYWRLSGDGSDTHTYLRRGFASLSASGRLVAKPRCC